MSGRRYGMIKLQCLLRHKIFTKVGSIEQLQTEKLQRLKTVYKQECRCIYCNKTFIRKIHMFAD